MSSIINSAKLRLCAAIVIAITLTTASTANASLQLFLTQRLFSVYSRVQHILASHGIHLPTGQSTTGGSTTTTSSSSGGLIKSGSGTLTLSGSNTYTGGVTVNSGTLTVSGSTTLNSGTTNINLGAITNQSGSGTIAAFGTLTNTNLGTLVLNGSNTYTGTTTINSGALQLGSTTTFDLNGNGATLVLSNPSTVNYSGVITSTAGTGALRINNWQSSGTPGQFVFSDPSAGLILGTSSANLDLANLSIALSALTNGQGSTGAPSAAIPEPGSVVLAGCGFAALFLARRRFTSKH